MNILDRVLVALLSDSPAETLDRLLQALRQQGMTDVQLAHALKSAYALCQENGLIEQLPVLIQAAHHLIGQSSGKAAH